MFNTFVGNIEFVLTAKKVVISIYEFQVRKSKNFVNFTEYMSHTDADTEANFSFTRCRIIISTQKSKFTNVK